MDEAATTGLYRGAHALRYDATWQDSAIWQAEARHHLDSLTELVGEGTRWLDVGCGTGWYLSRFPGVHRAGLDLSPDMLAQARAANPDAEFFVEADARDDVPEWRDAWNLVTCTGQPWSYVESIRDVEQFAMNLTRWTAPDGICFVPVSDITDVTGHEIAHRFRDERPPVDTVEVTGVIWSHYEKDVVSENMIWPSVDVWVRWLSCGFARIDIRRWPHDPPEPYVRIPRRVLVASEKRAEGDDRPAVIVEHPVPPGPHDAPEPATPPSADLDGGADGAGGAVAGGGAGATPPKRPSVGRVRLVDRPLSDLAQRFRPWQPRFWQAAARRVRPRLRRVLRRHRTPRV